MHDAGGAGHNTTFGNCEELSKEDIMKNLMDGNFYASEGGPEFVDMEIYTKGQSIH